MKALCPGCYGAAARYLAALATVLGRTAEAAAHFERALALNARTGARPYLAHTQREYADFLAARGAARDRARSDQLVAEARRTADELGMARLGRALGRGGRAARARSPSRQRRPSSGARATGGGSGSRASRSA